MYIRNEFRLIIKRLNEERRFIEVIAGPRQVGKTTLAKQVFDALKAKGTAVFYASADRAEGQASAWLKTQWDKVRLAARETGEAILFLDEIQKLPDWSTRIKAEWDADTWNGVNVKLVLLGSSRVRLQKDLAESLMGRFEEIRLTHWTWAEMRQAFGMSLDEYLYFGGYPGVGDFYKDEDRFSDYINVAMIDACINRDILMESKIAKPALLRQAFELGCSYSGEILSLTKLMGELNEAGNTTTLAHYFELFKVSGLMTALSKYSVDLSRRRNSPPKFQVFNSALKSALSMTSFQEARSDRAVWGRVTESALGAYLVSQAYVHNFEVYYWRDQADEVDYILRYKNQLVALEVKTNHEKSTRGLNEFVRRFNPKQALIIGPEGLSVEEFLTRSPLDFFN